MVDFVFSEGKCGRAFVMYIFRIAHDRPKSIGYLVRVEEYAHKLRFRCPPTLHPANWVLGNVRVIFVRHAEGSFGLCQVSRRTTSLTLPLPYRHDFKPHLIHHHRRQRPHTDRPPWPQESTRSSSRAQSSRRSTPKRSTWKRSTLRS